MCKSRIHNIVLENAFIVLAFNKIKTFKKVNRSRIKENNENCGVKHVNMRIFKKNETSK